MIHPFKDMREIRGGNPVAVISNNDFCLLLSFSHGQLETDTVPAVGDIIIVDKDCISERDSAELWKTPSNQVFKWADEEDDAPVMVWFDCETEMLVNKRTWKYDIEEEETVCILGVKFIHYEDL